MVSSSEMIGSWSDSLSEFALIWIDVGSCSGEIGLRLDASVWADGLEVVINGLSSDDGSCSVLSVKWSSANSSIRGLSSDSHSESDVSFNWCTLLLDVIWFDWEGAGFEASAALKQFPLLWDAWDGLKSQGDFWLLQDMLLWPDLWIEQIARA